MIIAMLNYDNDAKLHRLRRSGRRSPFPTEVKSMICASIFVRDTTYVSEISPP